MSYLRYALVPVLLCITLLLTGALSLQPARTVASSTSIPAAPSLEDPVAAELLGQAVEAWKPERVAWLRATIWQQVACEDFAYQADGCYLAGPDRRLRLQLHVLLGKTRSELNVVSDGTTLWQSIKVADAQPTITRAELKTVLHAADETRVSSRAGAEFYRAQGFLGIHPLLEGLQARMIVTRRESVVWHKRDAIRLTLAWNPASVERLAPAGQPWPAHLPSKCLLYLEANTLWPQRVEWWAPDPRRGDSLVLQMEMRDQVLNQPLTPAECAREFTFDPGPGNIPDLTETMRAGVAARSQEITAQAVATK